MSHPAHNAAAAAPALPVIELTLADLGPHGAVACPSPRAHMSAWASHPRIYLHPDTNGRAQCPYCGNVYQVTPPAQSIRPKAAE